MPCGNETQDLLAILTWGLKRRLRINTGVQRGIMWSRHWEGSIKLGMTVIWPTRLFTILRTTPSSPLQQCRWHSPWEKPLTMKCQWISNLLERLCEQQRQGLRPRSKGQNSLVRILFCFHPQETEHWHKDAEHLIFISFESTSWAVRTGHKTTDWREKIMHKSQDILDRC